jgi:intracellular multiplication protein IcmQ
MKDAITISSAEKAKAIAVRRQLLADIEKENAFFVQKLHEFSKDNKKAKEDYINLAQSVIAAIDNILGRADYEESLFLRNAIRPLKRIREQASDLLVQCDNQQKSKGYLAPILQKDMLPVYIHLFQSQGHDLESWAQLLRSLGRYVLGRPVYKQEEDVKSVIRAKMSNEQEGYVKVAVPAALLEVSNNASPRSDRFGNALVTLPAGIIDTQHILEFVHGKKRYHFVKGGLIDVSSRPTERD